MTKKVSILFVIFIITAIMAIPLASGFHSDDPKTRADIPAVVVDFTPDEPVDLNPVNVTITSKYGHEITTAYLSVKFIKSGQSRSGYYICNKVNDTIWYCIIPGDQNQGDTKVIFEASVWFDNIEIDSGDHEYLVGYKGTWKSTDFYENVKLTYSPAEPFATEPVNISIQSRSVNVPIKVAFLRALIKFPGGYPASEGGANFTMINSSLSYSLIPAYPGETNVTFWVDAYDDAQTKITSKKYNYIVKTPQSLEAPQFLYIYIFDDAKTDFADDAAVTISNETWSYQDKSINGMVWSPHALNAGTYRIRIKYDNEVITKNIAMPAEDENYTVLEFHFNMPKAEGLVSDFEDFPQWFVLATFLILILACPLFYYFYTELKARTRKKEIALRESMTRRRAPPRGAARPRPHSRPSSTHNIGTGAGTRAKAKWHGKYDKTAKRRRSITKQNRNRIDDEGHGHRGEGPGARSSSWSSRTGRADLNSRAGERGERDIGQESKPIWEPGMILTKILTNEDHKVTATKILGFFLLGLFGASWAPFYPWWMVLVVGIIVAAISYRFPYLALLALIMFVIGSTAYQNPIFGWLFMIFALIISVCSLFDWRFGYLVMMTIFVSRLGVAFIVPILSGILLSLFIGIAVAIASGIFFTFIVTSGDLTNLSFFIGSTHDYSFIKFSRPYVTDFMPTHFIDAIGSLNDVNLNSMFTILHSNYTSMLPFIQIIIWTLAVVVMVYLFQRFGGGNIKTSLMISLAPSAILIGSAGGIMLFFELSVNWLTWLLLFGIIGVMFFAITFAFMTMEFFREFYLGKTREMPIGTRINEMLSLRRTSFKEIGGLREIKRELKDTMIGPLLRPQKAKEYGVEPPRGIMLFGPPGCGKTLIMRALASELNVEMVGVRCSDVMSKWYGESESMIEKLFQAVKERKPCILFLDEIDAIAKRRDFYSADDVTPRLLSIMLSELDGMDESSGIIVVGATNKPELVDPALMRPGRFDKIIFIPAPNKRSRLDIFKIHLKGKPVSKKLNIEHLARGTKGFTGADIENVVKEAAMLTMKRSIRTGKPTVITDNDFLQILPRIKPSLTTEMKTEYDKLQQDFERKKYGKEIKLPPTEGMVKDRDKTRDTGAREQSRRKDIRLHKDRRDQEEDRRVLSKSKRARDPKKTSKWDDVVGLESSKRFFKGIIKNNIKGGK